MQMQGCIFNDTIKKEQKTTVRWLRTSRGSGDRVVKQQFVQQTRGWRYEQTGWEESSRNVTGGGGRSILTISSVSPPPPPSSFQLSTVRLLQSPVCNQSTSQESCCSRALLQPGCSRLGREEAEMVLQLAGPCCGCVGLARDLPGAPILGNTWSAISWGCLHGEGRGQSHSDICPLGAFPGTPHCF